MEGLLSNKKHELCILYGPELSEYGFDDPHPFSRMRLHAFWKEFLSRGLQHQVTIESPALCNEKNLQIFHTAEYIELVKKLSMSGDGFLDSGDTPAYIGVFEAACRIVGTTLKAMELIMKGHFKRAFCPIAGLHHARKNRAGGFCVFNDICVCIEILRKNYGLKRIGYVDIDAHHGDGVFYSYESDPDIFIADIHEDGRFLYPGTGSENETGTGNAVGTKLNLPQPPGASDKDFLKALKKIETFIESKKPEFILFQCGADSVDGDPLTHLRFSSQCHSQATSTLKALANRYANGRLLAMGGGGYDFNNIASAWCSVIEALV